MARVIRSPLAKQDIIEVIVYTTEHWGPAQTREYRQLINDALFAIAGNPNLGRPFSPRRPGVFAYPISRPGKAARHILFYRITSTGIVKILRLLHDAMDLEQYIS